MSGDMMVSVYLVTLAGVDSFRPSKYCEVKHLAMISS